MKKIISLMLVMILMVSGLFILTGCDNGGDTSGEENSKAEAKKDLATISYELGKGTITLSVPKKEDGTPKYEFTKEKPENMTLSGTIYLTTDTVNFAIGTSGLVYNTGKEYKEKYGETKATFDGYLEFVNDETMSSRPKLAGWEQLDINGRKAVRYYSRSGGSGEYTYYGYSYRVGVDDIYPGSGLDMAVTYNKAKEDLPKESQEFDQETLDIISSLKVVANQ